MELVALTGCLVLEQPGPLVLMYLWQKRASLGECEHIITKMTRSQGSSRPQRRARAGLGRAASDPTQPLSRTSPIGIDISDRVLVIRYGRGAWKVPSRPSPAPPPAC